MTDLEIGLKKYKDAFDRQEYKIAFQILSMFVKTEDAEVAYHLGYMYEMGLGVPQSYAEATHWYTIAHKKGHLLAQFRTGRAYYYGEMGVEPNIKLARDFLIEPAKKGVAEAQHIMGLIYESLTEVEGYLMNAHMWYNLAASNGHVESAIAREAIANKMSPQEVIKAQDLASSWIISNPQA